MNSSKHSSAISLQGYPSFVEDDDCFMVDEPKHLRVYLPKQVLVVKELLDFVQFEEKTFAPSKTKMQKERSELEGQVLSLTSNLLDQKREYEKELKKLTFWEQMLCDLQNGMDVVGLQSLISPLTFSLKQLKNLRKQSKIKT